MKLEDALQKMPLVAVLRGMPPSEALDVGNALVGAGFSVMEVPLNSPDPYASIRLQHDAFSSKAIVGAGTVLYAEEVSRVADAGGTIIVSPNFSEEVVRATKRCGLISVPGVMTPTEAFRALDAGADALKLFPGDGISPAVVKAMGAVLPKGTVTMVTGGVDAANIGDWMGAGATGCGIGSALYKPGKSAQAVASDAKKFSEAAAAALSQRAA
ncbi:MAG: 2-dehydro-3-deoxy-6-phosphogalactonate aldolase [Pseudomonadota bacterium]